MLPTKCFSSFGREVSEEKIKMRKLTDDEHGRRTPSDGKSSHCLWQGELKTQISKLVHTTCLWNNLHQVCSEQNFGKPNN